VARATEHRQVQAPSDREQSQRDNHEHARAERKVSRQAERLQ
jgi:hypothetical protein